MKLYLTVWKSEILQLFLDVLTTHTTVERCGESTYPNKYMHIDIFIKNYEKQIYPHGIGVLGDFCLLDTTYIWA